MSPSPNHYIYHKWSPFFLKLLYGVHTHWLWRILCIYWFAYLCVWGHECLCTHMHRSEENAVSNSTILPHYLETESHSLELAGFYLTGWPQWSFCVCFSQFWGYKSTHGRVGCFMWTLGIWTWGPVLALSHLLILGILCRNLIAGVKGG